VIPQTKQGSRRKAEAERQSGQQAKDSAFHVSFLAGQSYVPHLTTVCCSFVGGKLFFVPRNYGLLFRKQNSENNLDIRPKKTVVQCGDGFAFNGTHLFAWSLLYALEATAGDGFYAGYGLRLRPGLRASYGDTQYAASAKCCVNLYVCMYKVSILGVFEYFYPCITLFVFSCLFCFCFLIKFHTQ
jgi:hypothetical protein